MINGLMTFRGEYAEQLMPRQARNKAMTMSLRTLVMSKSDAEINLKKEMLGYSWCSKLEAIWVENMSGVNDAQLKKYLKEIWLGPRHEYASTAFFHNHFLTTVSNQSQYAHGNKMIFSYGNPYYVKFIDDMIDVMAVLYHRYNYYKSHIDQIHHRLVDRLEGTDIDMIFI